MQATRAWKAAPEAKTARGDAGQDGLKSGARSHDGEG